VEERRRERARIKKRVQEADGCIVYERRRGRSRRVVPDLGAAGVGDATTDESSPGESVFFQPKKSSLHSFGLSR
jgi:hypothetical protein